MKPFVDEPAAAEKRPGKKKQSDPTSEERSNLSF